MYARWLSHALGSYVAGAADVRMALESVAFGSVPLVFEENALEQVIFPMWESIPVWLGTYVNTYKMLHVLYCEMDQV